MKYKIENNNNKIKTIMTQDKYKSQKRRNINNKYLEMIIILKTETKQTGNI